jgi:hypothetical protein
MTKYPIKPIFFTVLFIYFIYFIRLPQVKDIYLILF